MLEVLQFPWVSVSLVTLLAASVGAWRAASGDAARQAACWALAVSTLSLLAAALDVARDAGQAARLEPWAALLPTGWFRVDALNAIPLPLFSGLALGVVALAPRRMISPAWVTGMLLVTASTLAAYAAGNLALLALGWAGSVAPFLTRRFFGAGEQEIPRISRTILLGCVGCLTAGVILLALGGGNGAERAWGLEPVEPGSASMRRAAFILLIAAVWLRTGLAPFQSWIVSAFERGPLLPLALLVNTHLGAFVLARVAIPILPEVTKEWLPFLGHLGLLTAVYAALLALVEQRPRRILALLSISQAAFLPVGLESGNAHGVAGALIHWQVVAVASTILAGVYAALEARIGAGLESGRYLGLAYGAPRLAVFFLIGGLTLVGLPLTLGFVGEDLLLHGALIRHPYFGVVLPIVTALNAFSVLRLFARLFLGKHDAEAHAISDALPRERWALTAAVLFLVIGGLLPGPLSRLPVSAAERLTHQISHSHQARNR